MNRSSFIKRLREIDDRYAPESPERRSELEKLRTEFWTFYIGQRLTGRSAGSPKVQTLQAARTILLKPNSNTRAGDSAAAKRTSLEEKHVTAAKVAWHKLLKAEGVTAANRAGKAQQLLERLERERDSARAVILNQIEQQVKELAELCERAEKVAPALLTPELAKAVRDLVKATQIEKRSH